MEKKIEIRKEKKIFRVYYLKLLTKHYKKPIIFTAQSKSYTKPIIFNNKKNTITGPYTTILNPFTITDPIIVTLYLLLF